MTIKQWETQAQASLDIAVQIEANFGGHPDSLEDLRFQVLPCPDQRTGKTLTCIAAYPRKEGATSDKFMAAIYG